MGDKTYFFNSRERKHKNLNHSCLESQPKLLGLSEDLLVDSVLKFCDGQSLSNLICCCQQLKDLLYSEEDLWQQLYRKFDFVNTKPKAPLFGAHNNAGSWREALQRASANEICVYIRPLGLSKERIRLVVNRKTTLFGLKKILRRVQLRKFGISLVDFELVDLLSLAPLGVQGNDSLPPSDLSILFVSSDTILRSVRASQVLRQILTRNQRPAWRKNLYYVEDGIELVQVFVGEAGSLQDPNFENLLTEAAAISAEQRRIQREFEKQGEDGWRSSSRSRSRIRNRKRRRVRRRNVEDGTDGGDMQDEMLEDDDEESGNENDGNQNQSEEAGETEGEVSDDDDDDDNDGDDNDGDDDDDDGQEPRQDQQEGNGTNLECCMALKQLGSGELHRLIDVILDPNACQDKKSAAYSSLCYLLTESNRSIRFNSFKPYWTEDFHPLLHIALCDKESKVSLKMRLKALIELFLHYIGHLFSRDFLVGSFARAFVGSGFPAIFTRIVSSIFPLILRTQIKQVMEGEIDWIPLIFATKFLVRVSILVINASTPILGFALAHQALKGLIRTIYTEETEQDDNSVYLLLILFSTLKKYHNLHHNKFNNNNIELFPRGRGRLHTEEILTTHVNTYVVTKNISKGALSQRIHSAAQVFKNVVVRLLNLDDANSYSELTRRVSNRMWQFLSSRFPRVSFYLNKLFHIVGDNLLIQYILSGMVWNIAEYRLTPFLSLSLPVYAYSVPFVVSVMLIRLRVALSDSYYYLLL